MNPLRFEMVDVFRRYGEPYFEKDPVSPEQFKVFNLMKICRTSKLGGHLEKCGHCDYERPAYNSCRNRHCPKCQGLAREKWLDARCGELLPTGYFHGVFTLPHLLNPVISCNKKECLGLLFQTVNEVLGAFARDPQWRLEGRIVSIGNNEVTFTYRDRSDNDQVKQMTVYALAFIRRFLRHVLPDGFMKIRYFGFLSHRHKRRCILLIRSLIGPGEKPPVKSEETIAAIIMRLTGADITCWPECGGRLRSYPLPVTPEMMEATPANTL